MKPSNGGDYLSFVVIELNCSIDYDIDLRSISASIIQKSAWADLSSFIVIEVKLLILS